jgi:predicted transposase/invertase (TIGR01784 family)
LFLRGDEIDPSTPPEALGGREFGEAMEIMATFTKSEMARDLYRRRLDFQREQSRLEKYDRELGREQGLAEGRAEGRAEIQAETGRRLKALGVDVDIIVQATGLPKEEVEGL